MPSKKESAKSKSAPKIADKVWSELTGFLLVLAALVILALLLGSCFRFENIIGGSQGTRVSRFLLAQFGLVAFLIPVLLLLVGVNLIRLQPLSAHARAGVIMALVGLWFELSLGYCFRFNHWRLPGTGFFYASGEAGTQLFYRLLPRVGHAGMIAILVAYAAILLVLLTPVQHVFGDWLRGLLAALHGLFTRRPAAEPAGTPLVNPPRPDEKIQAKPVIPKVVVGQNNGEPDREQVKEPSRPPEKKPRQTIPEPKKPAKQASIEGEFTFDRQEFLGMLRAPTKEDEPVKDQAEAVQEAESLLSKLREFGIDGTISSIYSGPVITRFELAPAPGVKIQRIEALTDDLALSLKAERIRILAPIPGKSAVGIEIPNRERKMVCLRQILTSPSFNNLVSPLGFALGQTITGEPHCADLSTMPHVLIAGTTGSGKSVCINTLVSSIIFRSSYDDVRFLTIDPKRLELPIYDPIPHLLFPTTVNSKEAVQKLDYVIAVMEARYKEFARVGARDIAGYNAKAGSNGVRRKPYIVVIIDELADLMLTAPREIEEKITRLAQMSRAVGIHLVLATQRPSVDVITGLIKANFPCRIAFQVASKTDSRTILDMNGAESLLGKGDMLFLPPGKGEPTRLHGAYISAEETQSIVRLLARRYLIQLCTGLIDPELVEAAVGEIIEKDMTDVLIEPKGVAAEEKKRRLCSVLPPDVVETLLERGYYRRLEESLPLPGSPEATEQEELEELDEFFADAARLVVQNQEASVSMLQRRLDVGWARAGRIIDQLERAGIVGEYVGSKSRDVLVPDQAELEKILAAQKTGL
jgi:S-DNA-T family DNA segregation ATPase FtsK/SpoIIIE